MKTAGFLTWTMITCWCSIPLDQTDKEAIQGEWIIQHIKRNGKDLFEGFADKGSLVFSEDMVRQKTGDEETPAMRFQVDPASSPKHIDLITTKGIKPGIYVFTDRKMVICLANVGANRPTQFEAGVGSGHVCFTLIRRAKE